MPTDQDLIDQVLIPAVSNRQQFESAQAQDKYWADYRAKLGVSGFGSPRVAESALQATLPVEITNWWARQGWEPDPTYKLTQPAYEQLTQGVDEDLWPRLAEGVSYEHSQFLRQQAVRMTENRRILASFGWKGKLLGTAAQFIDPVQVAAGVLTGGMASAATAGIGASRVAMLARAGLIGGVSMGSVEALHMIDDPSVTVGDVGMSALGGAGFGVGAGMSRMSGQLTRALAAEFEARGARYLDAPVARTRQAAEAGTLSVMVGGDAETFARVQPILACIASEITHCGVIGSGQVTKILNNMVLFETVAALSEAYAIARRAGLDPALLFDTLAKGSADSFALRSHGMKAIIPQTFPERAFSVEYARKDLAYALELAADTKVDAEGARRVDDLFERAIQAGLGEQYHPVISRIVDQE